MKKQITILAFLLFFLRTITIFGQQPATPAITFTTDSIGAFAFTLHTGMSNTSVQVDWGNGVLQNYTSGSNKISGFTQGASPATVKIYSTGIYFLSIKGKKVKSLDITSCTALSYLDCSDNLLSTLDLSKNTAIMIFDCSNNLLTTLDLSKNTNLNDLFCSNNLLTTLDLSKNTRLGMLRCPYNQLTTLNLSENAALIELACYNNRLPLIELYKASRKFFVIPLMMEKRLGIQTQVYFTDKTIALDSALNLSEDAALAELVCFNNRLPLIGLYKASQEIVESPLEINKLLGTQTQVHFTDKTIALYAPLDLSSEAVMGGANTMFAIKKGAANALLDTDYTIFNGIITFKTTGSYTVEMNNAAIISDVILPAKAITGTITVKGWTGIADPDAAQLKVYPNPTKGELNVEGGKQSQIYLYNLSGRLIGMYPVTGEKTELNISHLPAGTYLLKVDGKTEKVIIKK